MVIVISSLPAGKGYAHWIALTGVHAVDAGAEVFDEHVEFFVVFVVVLLVGEGVPGETEVAAKYGHDPPAKQDGCILRIIAS